MGLKLHMDFALAAALYVALLLAVLAFQRHVARRPYDPVDKARNPAVAKEVEASTHGKVEPLRATALRSESPQALFTPPLSRETSAEVTRLAEPVGRSDDLSQPIEAATPKAVPSTSRPFSTAAINPDHFKRHAGVPGFLYLARNDERRDHLYKIGYTTGLPQGRIKGLSDQVAEATDIGSFRLVHSVPVGSSYDMEQALFVALAERRVVGEREFFYGQEKNFMRAMDALARMPEDRGETLNDFLASNPWGDLGCPPPAVLAECPVPQRSSPEGGWLYVCQNFWHKPGTFYFSVTKETPTAVVNRLNEGQRQLTSQLGFYRIVACRAVDSTETARQHAQLLFSPYRIDTRKQFVRALLDVVQTIVESVNGGVAASTNERPVKERAATNSTSARKQQGPDVADTVVGSQGLSQASNALEGLDSRVRGEPESWQLGLLNEKCDSCGSGLRFQGQRGSTTFAECPKCQRRLKKVGSGRFT